jgi:hypothetical protein
VNPGFDTVTFVSVTNGEPDRLGVLTPVETSTSVMGCSFQPLSVKDQVSNTEYAEATHKNIAPPVAAAVACKAEDRQIFNGENFRVIGVKTYFELGSVHHVDVIVKFEVG